MRRHRACLAALVLLIAGCATAPPLSPPARAVPDLRGSWTGSWGGTPLTLRVLEQGHDGEGGVHVGPWQVLGDRLPGVSGIMTYTTAGQARSVNMRGRVGESAGRLTLVVEPLTGEGQTLVLAVAGPDRLEGTGASRLAWDPQGPVELSRTSP